MANTKSLLLAVAAAAMGFSVSCSSNNSFEGITLSSNSEETAQSSSSEEMAQSSSSEEMAQSSSSEETARSSSSEEATRSSSSEETARSSSSASLCAGQEYDPDIFRCEFGELVGKCAGGDFYPAYQICDGGVIKNKNESSSSSEPPLSSSSSVEDFQSSSSSSSEKEISSSSSSISSSSYGGLCAGFVDGTEIEHYGKMKKQFCDERDGKRYVYVEIGTQTWMAENLNYEAEDGKCYGEGGLTYIGYNQDGSPFASMLPLDEIRANCTKYGRLYNWATAMGFSLSCNVNYCARPMQPKHRGICPSGWHIPNTAEWSVLVNYVGSDETAGRYLKVAEGWLNCGPSNGYSYACEDTYGFSALPGGRGNSTTDRFSGGGKYSYWWMSNENSDIDTFYRYMNNENEYAKMTNFDKIYRHSVRCVKD